jgi:hypothetical protein
MRFPVKTVEGATALCAHGRISFSEFVRRAVGHFVARKIIPLAGKDG